MKSRRHVSARAVQTRRDEYNVNKRCAILLLCIPVAGWLVLSISFIKRLYRRPDVGGDRSAWLDASVSSETKKVDIQTFSRDDAFVHPDAVHYEEELLEFCRLYGRAIINQSYKGMIHVLDYPLQLISLLVVRGEDPHGGERYLRLLVSNESSEPIDYCEWAVDRLYLDDGREFQVRLEPLRFYQHISPWSSAMLSLETPLPVGSMDMELRLKVVMYASSGRAVVYDSSPRIICQWLPHRLMNKYPQKFIDQYLATHGIGGHPLYIYAEQADAGIRFSHCPYCGHFNPVSADVCKCCHTPKATQKQFLMQTLDAAYQDFCS